MFKRQNTLTLALMFSSILLLLVLQFLWLRSTYNKAFDDLHKETNMLFRNTVFAMRDSIIERSIEPMPGDSLKTFRFHSGDSMMLREDFLDSSINQFGRHERISKVKVLVGPGMGDPATEDIKPMVSTFYNFRGGEGNFVLRLTSDSLNTDSIDVHFKKALHNSGIDVPFQIVQMKRGEKLPRRNSMIISDQVRYNPGHRYSVSLSSVTGLLIRQIVPQILFSIFLTGLTIVSFYIMYRNLVAQQRLADMKNDFISNVTHELKTPITTVKVALEALRNFKGLDNPQLTREYLDIAQSELNRLTILTDKVLKTAIFEKNGVVFQSEHVDMEQVVEQVMASMKLLFEKHSAKVVVEKQGSDFTLTGSADHLTNVLYNLLDNALKYDSGKPEIAIGIKDAGSQVVLTVRDNGPGIAAEFHKKIFEKFFRVPTGDVHTIKGYGLGLSYVASVIRSHDGIIQVESEPGKGSCFMITLPKNEKD